jgi:hypothetical protein
MGDFLLSKLCIYPTWQNEIHVQKILIVHIMPLDVYAKELNSKYIS